MVSRVYPDCHILFTFSNVYSPVNVCLLIRFLLFEKEHGWRFPSWGLWLSGQWGISLPSFWVLLHVCCSHSPCGSCALAPPSYVVALRLPVFNLAVKVIFVGFLKNLSIEGRSQDGGGIGRGDHFLSYKFIERTIERWTSFTKQLLITSSWHQAPRKATHCIRSEVGQNIKGKTGAKRARDGDPSWEGSFNRGSFQSPGNPRAGGSEGSFQILEGNLTGRKN